MEESATKSTTKPATTNEPLIIEGTGDHAGKKLRVAAYCRVSTEQEEQENSFENQVKTYKKMITQNPEWEYVGIYADEGISGTRVEKRAGFLRMLEDCKQGKIDRIITKSISRFARNTLDCLTYTRELSDMGISIFFQEENLLSTDSNGKLVFTILAAMAEQESRNISEHTKWGIRARYRNGQYRDPADLKLYGFAHDRNGNVIVNKDEAGTVQLIYNNFLEGMFPSEIARSLNEMGIPGRGGKDWTVGVVSGILTNEKYKGDVILQKTYVDDPLSHKTIKNHGERTQYHYEDAHPAIIDKLTWEAVQLEFKRREKLEDPNGRSVHGNSINPYTGKIFYKGGCRMPMSRNSYGSNREHGGTWKCRWCRRCYKPVCLNPDNLPEEAGALVRQGKLPTNVDKSTLLPCHGFPVAHSRIEEFFLMAWNDMIDDDLESQREKWNSIVESEQHSALKRVRAKQMLELTQSGQGSKLTEAIPEIVRMVLERIEVTDIRYADVYFLDGTVREVEAGSEWG